MIIVTEFGIRTGIWFTIMVGFFFNFLPSEMNRTFKILLCKLQDVKLFFPVLLFFSLTSSREEKVVE